MMHRIENTLIKKLDSIVSAFILTVIVMLILFTVATFIKGPLNVVQLFFAQPKVPIEDLLHGVAVMLIFVKAYKILASYYVHQHISIKFLMEIAIIACTVEVLFNAKNISLPLSIVLALFGTANLLIYLVFSEKLESLENRAGDKPGA